jgi:hypothetical protein
LFGAIIASQLCCNEKRLPSGSLFSELNLKLAVGDVHRYFKAKTHFGVLGLGPHDLVPLEKLLTGVSMKRTAAFC